MRWWCINEYISFNSVKTESQVRVSQQDEWSYVGRLCVILMIILTLKLAQRDFKLIITEFGTVSPKEISEASGRSYELWKYFFELL